MTWRAISVSPYVEAHPPPRIEGAEKGRRRGNFLFTLTATGAKHIERIDRAMDN